MQAAVSAGQARADQEAGKWDMNFMCLATHGLNEVKGAQAAVEPAENPHMVLCIRQLTAREGRCVESLVRRTIESKAGLLRSIRRQRVREHKVLEALRVEARDCV